MTNLADEVIARDRGLCHFCGAPGADTARRVGLRQRRPDQLPTEYAAVHEDCNATRPNRWGW